MNSESSRPLTIGASLKTPPQTQKIVVRKHCGTDSNNTPLGSGDFTSFLRKYARKIKGFAPLTGLACQKTLTSPSGLEVNIVYSS